MEKFVGIQVGPPSLYDEGIDRALDLMQEAAGVNALIPYSHTYYGANGRPAETLASDHGMDAIDERKRNLNMVWVTHHDEFFRGTILRHKNDPGRQEYAGRDILTDLKEPARKRGMKVYARILEPNLKLMPYIDNMSKALAVDVYGRLHPSTCFNNPDYKNFWLSTVEDMFKNYDIDGMQYGSERCGPLSRLLFWDDVPACFCEHCCARARSKGVDAVRARQGFQVLYEYIEKLKAGKDAPVDGPFPTFIRILLKYPEILAWEYQAHESKEDLAKLLYGTMKAVKPGARFGLHIDHQESTWDIFQIAEIDYSEVARYCDFLKPIAYHDIAARRVKKWYLEKMNRTIFKGVPLESILAAFYGIMGYDGRVEPKLDEMDENGFTEEYVYTLTKRIADGLGGRVPVYTGIGFDVPWENRHVPADPERVYRAVKRAFDAGAEGIVISREYSEMRVANLKAVGRAMREINAR